LGDKGYGVVPDNANWLGIYADKCMKYHGYIGEFGEVYLGIFLGDSD
jgi:hypothetical protein